MKLKLTFFFAVLFSVSLQEAMASGLSAVLTDVPSNLEGVQSGVNGESDPRGDWKRNFAAIDGIYHTLMKGGRRVG